MRRLAPIRAGAIAVAALVLSACIPLPGSSINVCALCLHSHAATRSGDTPTNTDAAPDAALAMPALPGSTLLPETGRAPPDPGAGVEPGNDNPHDPNPERARPEAAPPAERTSGAATRVREPASGDDPGAAAAAAPGEPHPELAQRIREAEDLSLGPYEDTGGVLHICYGHKITVRTCDRLLAQDMADARAAAERVVGESTWNGLTERRRDALAEIAYMAGPTGLARFTEMIDALHAGDYGRAADEIILSQLRPPTRAVRLANMMREG